MESSDTEYQEVEGVMDPAIGLERLSLDNNSSDQTTKTPQATADVADQHRNGNAAVPDEQGQQNIAVEPLVFAHGIDVHDEPSIEEHSQDTAQFTEHAAAVSTATGQQASPAQTNGASAVHEGPSQGAPGAPSMDAEEPYAVVEDPAWRQQSRHMFILSNAGKPLLSLHGDESQLAGLMAAAQALISVVKNMDGDSLKFVRAGKVVLAFLERGPLYLVGVARGPGGHPCMLQMALELSHHQLTMLLTSAMEKMVDRNPRYDPRSLLPGTDALMHNLWQQCERDVALVLTATAMLPLSPAVRQLLLEDLAAVVKDVGASYALVLSRSRSCVGCHQGPGAPPLHPHDVALLANFVWGTESFSQGDEAFSPVCLPHINPNAYFHMYIRFLDSAQRLPLLLLGTDPEFFSQASSCAGGLVERMQHNGMLQALEQALGPSQPQGAPRDRPWGQLSLSSIPERAGGGPLGATSLLHFAYRHTAIQQVCSSTLEPPLDIDGLQQDLMVAYLRIRNLMLGTRPGVPAHRTWTERGPKWVMLAQVTDAHELYITCDPLTPLEEASETAARLLSWIKSQLPIHFQLTP